MGRRKLVMIRTVAGFNFADECWTELQRTCCLVKGCARFVYDAHCIPGDAAMSKLPLRLKVWFDSFEPLIVF